MAARIPLRFARPERPAKAIGHCADCGHSLRIICSPAVNGANRHCSESAFGRMFVSVARTTQPSFIAASRYHGASIMLVQAKSVVEVTMRIGHGRDGSKPFGKNSRA